MSIEATSKAAPLQTWLHAISQGQYVGCAVRTARALIKIIRGAHGAHYIYLGMKPPESRHCEERQRRGNLLALAQVPGDCFAPLAMTA